MLLRSTQAGNNFYQSGREGHGRILIVAVHQKQVNTALDNQRLW